MYLEYKTRLELAAILMSGIVQRHNGTDAMQAHQAFEKLDALIDAFEARIKDGKYKA